MSVRAQRILVWWSVVFITIYGLALGFLLHMIPPPRATMTANEVAAWYQAHKGSIRVGAVIASWTSAFMLPLSVVVGTQMARIEKGRSKAWTITVVASGAMMSLFLVLPPLFWGVAAFTPTRGAEITQLMHQLGMLTLVTTDQYYIFMWVGIVIVCLTKTGIKHSPFARWYGYFTAWTALMFEAGAIAFLTKTGPFAWNGLLVFWSPLTLFGAWIAVTCNLLLKALKNQAAEEAEYEALEEQAVLVNA